MDPKRRSFIRATLTMTGTIIGAGIFAVPGMMGRVGVLTGTIIFAGIALLVLSSHLLYVEIIARDAAPRRWPGHVGVPLGSWAKLLGVIMHVGQITGAGLAYLILGGEFLSAIAGRIGLPSQLLFWQVLFWIGGVITVLYGLRIIAKVESALTWLLLGLLFILIAFAAPHGDPSLLSRTDWSRVFEPVGVFLFSLIGMMGIAEVHDINGRVIGKTRRSVAIGSIAAATLTWLVGITVYIALGSSDALDVAAWSRVFPAWLWWLIPTVGFVAVADAFVGTYDLASMIRLDLKQPRWLATSFALGAPLVLLFVTQRDFVATISFVGSLFTAATGVLIAAAASIAMNKDRRKPPVWWRDLVPLFAASLFVIVILHRLFAFRVD